MSQTPAERANAIVAELQDHFVVGSSPSVILDAARRLLLEALTIPANHIRTPEGKDHPGAWIDIKLNGVPAKMFLSALTSTPTP